MRATPAITDAVLARVDPETGAVTELHGLREIRQELGPVRRLRPPDKPAAREPKRGARTEPTKQRISNAADGIQEESLASYKRPRITLPMALLPVLVHDETQQLHAKRTGEKPNEPPLHKTRLDHALDHDETGSLRWALSRYVTDLLTTQESPSAACWAGEGGKGVPRSRVPFSALQQAALSRLAHIRGRLSRRDREGLELFAVMMGARHSTLAPISLAEFGRARTGLQDTRVQEGAAIAIILGLAEKLDAIYRSCAPVPSAA